MYITVNQEESVKYDKLKLCYIGRISETYWDYTPEAKAYRETEEWKEQDRLREEKFRRVGALICYDDEFGILTNPILRKGSDSQDYPNPEYIEGKQEFYAYFTPISLDKQWGDDWNDAPYEHNAGVPYDDYYDGDERVETEIIVVPFYIPHDGWTVRLPEDYGGGNSPFAVEDINGGAVAWIYDGLSRTAINAGSTPAEFFEKVDRINERHKEEYGDESD